MNYAGLRKLNRWQCYCGKQNDDAYTRCQKCGRATSSEISRKKRREQKEPKPPKTLHPIAIGACQELNGEIAKALKIAKNAGAKSLAECPRIESAVRAYRRALRIIARLGTQT